MDFDMTGISVRHYEAALMEAHREIAKLKGERDQAYRYATELFTALAPQCTPLDDTFGVIMQIDNYIVGLKLDRAAAVEMVREMEASAIPNSRDHPTMSPIWKKARGFLAGLQMERGDNGNPAIHPRSAKGGG